VRACACRYQQTPSDGSARFDGLGGLAYTVLFQRDDCDRRSLRNRDHGQRLLGVDSKVRKAPIDDSHSIGSRIDYCLLALLACCCFCRYGVEGVVHVAAPNEKTDFVFKQQDQELVSPSRNIAITLFKRLRVQLLVDRTRPHRHVVRIFCLDPPIGPQPTPEQQAQVNPEAAQVAEASLAVGEKRSTRDQEDSGNSGRASVPTKRRSTASSK